MVVIPLFIICVFNRNEYNTFLTNGVIFMKKIEFKETIELFAERVIYEIKNGRDVPNINFNFGKDGLELFNDVKNNPHKLQGSWTPDIKDEDIEKVMTQDEGVLTIDIQDANKFFNLLTDIINASLELSEAYNDSPPTRSFAMFLMRRIWLRMSIEDFVNVERFLERQLEFAKNYSLETYDYTVVDKFYDYKVKMKTINNPNWDESTRSMIFSITDELEEGYELPHILYDIDSYNNCYIYGVQSAKYNHNSKSIERKLYKINKGIENPNVHPSKVYSLMYFINELKKKGITTIVVPSMQVLNYEYHQIIGERARDDVVRIGNMMSTMPSVSSLDHEYENAVNWYNKVYNREDKISYLKTEELFNLMYRLTEQDPDINVVNDINIQGDYLKLKIKRRI